MLCQRCKTNRAYYHKLCVMCLDDDVRNGSRSWLKMDAWHTLRELLLLCSILLLIVLAMYLTRPGGPFDLFGGRSDKKFEPKLVHEPPPQLVYGQYCRTSVVFPWP